MANHVPPALAKKLTVYGKTVAIWVQNIFDGNDSIKATYEDNGTWHFLAQPDYYVANLSDKAKTDEYFDEALQEINTAIETALKPKDGGDEPENGSERIEWLLGQLIVTNNVVTKG